MAGAWSSGALGTLGVPQQGRTTVNNGIVCPKTCQRGGFAAKNPTVFLALLAAAYTAEAPPIFPHPGGESRCLGNDLFGPGKIHLGSNTFFTRTLV